MVKPTSVEKFGNDMLIRMDDGTRYRALETVGDIWIAGAITPVPEPPPPSSTRFVWPFPLSTVTSEYGPRNGRLHAGMDFSGGEATNGAIIKASASGIVDGVWTTGQHGGYGNCVLLSHGNGLYTLYAHMQNGSFLVTKGQSVAQNQGLGKVGNTGNSYGAHLHFETHEGGYRWNESSRNPRVFIPKWNAA